MADQGDEASLKGLLQRLDTLNERLKTPPSNVGNIRIDVGAAGIWIAATACACMTVVTLLFAMWAMFEISDLKDTDKLHRAYIDQLMKQVQK